MTAIERVTHWLRDHPTGSGTVRWYQDADGMRDVFVEDLAVLVDLARANLAANRVRHSDPDTSHQAAPRAGLRSFAADSASGRMLGAFKSVGAFGATYAQAVEYAAVWVGTDDLVRLESFRKRGSDLRRAGFIADTGRRHDGQVVWEITPAGREYWWHINNQPDPS